MQVAFIIPLITRPAQCINSITPNDMQSSLSCAFSGAFLLGGGWCVVIWVFLRALSLHLQICWRIVTGRKFFIGAQLFGWSTPAVFLAIVLSITGVSFKFGDTCQINSSNSLAAFWGPMLGFAAAAIIIQFSTTTTGSSALPSPLGSVRIVSARQAFKRIKRVFALQWRGILIVILIIADVAFFAIAFIKFDESTGVTKMNMRKAEKWLTCLVISNGDKHQCLSLAKKLTISEATAIAVLILLSMNGIWCLLFLGRWEMVTGWIDWFKEKLGRKSREFVSVDARRFSHGPRTYEMIWSSGIKSPEPAITSSPEGSVTGRISPSKGSDTSYHFSRDTNYVSPAFSFSLPRSAVYQARGTILPDKKNTK
ncbi:MAG: hypothetical protein M1813_001059 [Trichoglossum hirsutum]|nr:MAG: hypothetical protein M1813_001059 [Trichoglossum hirsutum]